MKENELLQRLVAALETSMGMSARELATLLGVTPKEVNPVLYKHKGTSFVVEPGAPPIWRSANVKQIAPTTKTVLLAKSASENGQNIRLLGNVWKVHLQVSKTSRNDPAFAVESLGGRERIITVSVHVLSDDHSMKAMGEGYIPDAVYALASAALVNEALVKDSVQMTDDLLFANAVTEVLLQFSAAARSTMLTD